jgi:GH35 family endo-1,4-beta-xylanase
MRKNTKRVVAGAMALALTLTTIGVAAPSTEAQAAAKIKLSKKSISLTAKKSQKITIKNVKAKKVKKLTVKSSKKKIATVKKKGKTAFTVKGISAGNAVITAKVTLKGKKKATSLKLKVKVKAAADNATVTQAPSATDTAATAATATPQPATAAPSASADTTTATPAGSQQPTYVKKTLQKVTVETEDATSADSMQDGNAVTKSDEVVFDEDFENLTVSSKTEVKDGKEITQYVAGDAISGRGDEVFQISSEGNDGNCLQITNRYKNWHGMRINFEDLEGINKGCKYKITVDVKSKGALNISYELKTLEDSTESYSTPFAETKTAPTNWTTISGEFTVPDSFSHFAVYIQADSSTDADIFVDNVKIQAMEVVNPLENLTSLYETYKDIFPYVGTAASYAQFQGSETMAFMKSQYNCVTPGNEFKPDAIMSSTGTTVSLSDIKADPETYKDYYIPDGYESDEANQNKSGTVVVPKLDFTTVDEMLKLAKENGLKVRFHTLLWHEQTPVFFFQKNYVTSKNNKKNNYNVDASTMDKRIEFYVRSVMNHVLTSEYADTVYAFDVVNEYLHSGGASSNTSPTYYEEIYNTSVGEVSKKNPNGTQSGRTTEPSYVKLAFQAARAELKEHNKENIKLFYNDYNCYDVSEDICHLMNYVNSDEKLCDGVGMQSHLDMEYPTTYSYQCAIEMFRVNLPDLEIQITELDVTNTLTDDKTATKYTDKEQAAYYYDLMKGILKEKQKGANISALIIWGLYDGLSWRSERTPLIFNGLNSPKSAYYALLDVKAAMDAAVVDAASKE